MSIKYDTDVECPQCGVHNEVTIWGTINVQLDPEAREDLLQGKINVFQCASCGAVTRVDTDLLYNDFANGICVWYSPKDPETISLQSFINEAKAKWKPVGDKTTEDFLNSVHGVSSVEEMVGYILLRENRAK